MIGHCEPITQEPIRLVPRALWGVSLAALCTGRHWKRLGERIAGPATGCRFAASPGFHTRGPLHGHERWHYGNGRARLQGIWWLCSACHEIFHPGRAQAVSGEAGLRRVIARYAERCEIPRDESARRVEAAFTRFHADSRLSTWTVDLGDLPADLLPLRCKAGKRSIRDQHRWEGDPFGVIADSAAA